MAAATAAGNDFFLLLSLSSVKLASFFSFRERARLLALSVNSPLLSLSLSVFLLFLYPKEKNIFAKKKTLSLEYIQ